MPARDAAYVGRSLSTSEEDVADMAAVWHVMRRRCIEWYTDLDTITLSMVAEGDMCSQTQVRRLQYASKGRSCLAGDDRSRPFFG